MRLEARPRRSAINCNVDIGRIDVEFRGSTAPVRSAAMSVVPDPRKRSSTTAVPGHILNGVGNQPGRLDCWMQGQILPPAASRGVH